MAKKAKKRVVKKVAKKRKPEVVLPMKLSSLISIALKDIRKAEKLPKKLIIDMDNWFVPETVECRTSGDVLIETHKICSVCAAGSVMAFSLGALGRDNELSPSSFPKNFRQLEAINYLREGNASGAITTLYDDPYDPDSEGGKLRTKAGNLNCTIPYYDNENPEPFHKAMTNFQERLKKAGL